MYVNHIVLEIVLEPPMQSDTCCNVGSNIDQDINQKNSPIEPLQSFFRYYESIFGKNEDPDKESSDRSVAQEKWRRKVAVWTCVKNELVKRKLLEPLFGLLESNTFQEVHRHVVYLLGSAATGTIESGISVAYK
jgi:hypothetical protein